MRRRCLSSLVLLPHVRVLVRPRREGVLVRGKGGEVEEVGDVERLSTAVGVVTPLFGAVEFAEEEVEERFVRLKIPIVEVCVGEFCCWCGGVEVVAEPCNW